MYEQVKSVKNAKSAIIAKQRPVRHNRFLQYCQNNYCALNSVMVAGWKDILLRSALQLGTIGLRPQVFFRITSRACGVGVQIYDASQLREHSSLRHPLYCGDSVLTADPAFLMSFFLTAV